jgi:exodeoxyribonuclease V beta subunit
VHRAKGLEFPIVYCPFLWYSRPENSTGPVVFHDPAQGWARTLDAGCPDRDGPAKGEYDGHARIARDERRGEDLRLLYVAVTRARHQVVVWWGRASGSRMSPLGRLLVSRDQSTGEVRPPQSAEPGGGQVRKSLAAIAEKAPGLIEVEAAGDAAEGRPPSPGGAAGSLDLVAARFERALDLTWRRSSYSSITAEAHGLDRGPAVGSEPEAPGLADEPDEPAAAAPLLAPGPPEGAIASPFNGIPGGAAAGTYVHALLERVDFTAADLTGEVVEAMAALDGAPPAPAAVLAPALATALSTPLGPLVEGVSLSAVGRPDRMDELSFELPVAGGDSPFGRVHLEQIATVLESHSGELGPVAGYQAQLQDPALAPSIRGYLTGSLDLVFRRPGPGGEPRWYLADYKTNHLGGDPATTAHYHPAALAAEMYRRHYPLQALLYLVALHRYLRWRQPGYRPERHLGGVLYLFLRGMAGPATPLAGGSPCGVFAWAPPAALVEDLSTLFDGNGR